MPLVCLRPLPARSTPPHHVRDRLPSTRSFAASFARDADGGQEGHEDPLAASRHEGVLALAPTACFAIIGWEAVRGTDSTLAKFRASPVGEGSTLQVSGFGSDTESDEGDAWSVTPEAGDVWLRGQKVKASSRRSGVEINVTARGVAWQVTLTHVITNAPLVTKQEFDFNQNNCGGNCPIAGQLEVSAVSAARILLPAPVQSGGRSAVVWLFVSGARRRCR